MYPQGGARHHGSMGTGGVDALAGRIRGRVPLAVIWAVLSAASVIALRVIDPHTRAFEYAQSPLFIGVAFIASRAVPGRHSVWLSALIGAAVSLLITMSWKALS